MDLFKIILQNTKDIKELRRQVLCCTSGGGGGGTLTDAQNGLHLDGTIAKLGGALTDSPTTITGDTLTEKVIFNGVSQQDLSDLSDAFVQITAGPGDGFGGPIALGVSAEDPVGNFGTGIWVQNSSTGINILGGDSGISITNTSSIGINVNSQGSGMTIAASTAGLTTTSDFDRAVNATSQGTLEAGRFVASNAPFGLIVESNATASQGLQVIKRNFDAGLVGVAAVFRTASNFVFTPNYVTAININAPFGSGDSSSLTASTQLRSKWPAVGGGTAYSQTEIWGWAGGFPGAAVQSFTISHQNGGKIGIAGATTPTARLHLPAGTTAATTAPLKFTSGPLLTTAEAGAIEFLTDKFYATITTGAARKEFALNDITLTAGRVPFTTTDGRLTDSANLVWSSANNRLGIGIAPQRPLDVLGIIRASYNGVPQAIEIFDTDRVIGSSGSGHIDIQGATISVGNSGVFPTTTSRLYVNGSTTVTGSLSVGSTSNPTAKITIAAGTATAGTAPLKLTAGTNLTTPEDGAFEFDGTNLYFTVGGVRRTVTLV